MGTYSGMKTRPATEDEQKDMMPWLRFGYERGAVIAYWKQTGVYTLAPSNPDPHYCELLEKE